MGTEGNATGEIEKLTIEPYTNTECTSAGTPQPFKVMFNPNTFAIKNEVEYKPDKAHGTSVGSPKFGQIKPRDYTIEFILDGTGAAADAPADGVAGRIKHLMEVTMDFVGDTHRPHFLKLVWGEHINLKVVAKSVDVTYSLFSPNGDPIRAKVNAVFTDNIEDSLRVRQENSSSPDLTHIREVRNESKLPLMVFKEYKDHTYYLTVARANKLNNFRNLTAGSKIKLPPVKVNDTATS